MQLWTFNCSLAGGYNLRAISTVALNPVLSTVTTILFSAVESSALNKPFLALEDDSAKSGAKDFSPVFSTMSFKFQSLPESAKKSHLKCQIGL